MHHVLSVWLLADTRELKEDQISKYNVSLPPCQRQKEKGVKSWKHLLSRKRIEQKSEKKDEDEGKRASELETKKSNLLFCHFFDACAIIRNLMPEIQLLRSVHVTYILGNKLRFSEILLNKELYGTIVKTHCSGLKHSYSPSHFLKLNYCIQNIYSDLNCSAY